MFFQRCPPDAPAPVAPVAPAPAMPVNNSDGLAQAREAENFTSHSFFLFFRIKSPKGMEIWSQPPWFLGWKEGI